MSETLRTPFSSASQNVQIRKLGPEDWRGFSDYRLSGMRANGLSQKIINEMQGWGQDIWQKELGDPDKAFFAAFSDDRYVGHGCLFKAQLQGQNCREIILEISPDYTRLGIGARMYETMKAYAREHFPDDITVARILPDNSPSIRAAQKAGFSHADDIVSNGVQYGLYIST